MTPWAPWTTQPARPLCPWGFSRQEYWSGFPCLSPEDLPNPGNKPRSPAMQADSLPSEPAGKPIPRLGIKPRLPTLWVQSLKPLYLFIIFISIALGDWPRKTLVWFMSENVLPMFSSRSFMASCLRFRFKSFNIFWVYFWVWCEEVWSPSLIYMQLSNFPTESNMTEAT